MLSPLQDPSMLRAIERCAPGYAKANNCLEALEFCYLESISNTVGKL